MRSGFEAAIKLQFDEAGVEVEYEPFRIPYYPTKKFYKPDWLILHNGIVVETKGYFESKDRSKLLAVKEQHPTLDVRLLFSNAHNRISKKSTTTYAIWCESKGFQWAEKRVPQAWLNAPANLSSLAAIRKLKEAVST